MTVQFRVSKREVYGQTHYEMRKLHELEACEEIKNSMGVGKVRLERSQRIFRVQMDAFLRVVSSKTNRSDESSFFKRISQEKVESQILKKLFDVSQTGGFKKASMKRPNITKKYGPEFEAIVRAISECGMWQDKDGLLRIAHVMNLLKKEAIQRFVAIDTERN